MAHALWRPRWYSKIVEAQRVTIVIEGGRQLMLEGEYVAKMRQMLRN
jgi:hypothetical protein